MPKLEVTLDNCADEPIHIPGSIQPHGYLIAIEQNTWVISRLSQNVEQIIPGALNSVGKSAEELLGKEFIQELKSSNKRYGFKDNLFHWRSGHNNTFFHVIASICQGMIILDLETKPDRVNDISDFYKKTRNFVNDFNDVLNEDEVYDRAVSEVRKLTKFDRVMLYKFDQDYNGQVVAESKVGHLNSFLHQHFPESDIPKQARDLYLRNPIRLLADVDATPSPIIPDINALDLSSSSLRSVSPIHIQYLKNMGVKASMSISIVVEDKLWGLIACHHYSSHIVPFDIREAALFMGQMISYVITMRERSTQGKIEGELQWLNALLIERMAQEIDFEDGLKAEIPTLLKLMGADGIAWNLTGKLQQFGKTPSHDETQEIIDWLKSKKIPELEYHTHSLAKENKKFERFSTVASGILALPIVLKEKQILIWFRPEIIETKNWGGKPEKVIEFTDDGSHRLMPRSSFALWKENVKNRSTVWQDVEISAALKFRNSLMNYVVHKSQRLKEINLQLEQKIAERTEELVKEISIRREAEKSLKATLQEAHRSNAELEQFAYVASHDLQEPLRKIQSFGERLRKSSENLDSRSSDYIERMMNASNRMQLLIQNLLSFSRITTMTQPFEEIVLNELLDEVLDDLQPFIEEHNAKVEVGKLEIIRGDMSQIHRVFQNLIQNAIKFKKADVDPVITIESYKSEDQLIVVIGDNGIGFDDKYKDKVFGLFERLHGRSEYEGTGLGLAICRKIMERHKGQIRAESELGSGTKMFLSFKKVS